MADRTLTINHADGDSETYTINRDKFAGVWEMSRGHVYALNIGTLISTADFTFTKHSDNSFTAAPNNNGDWKQINLLYNSEVRTGKHLVEFDLTLSSGSIAGNDFYLLARDGNDGVDSNIKTVSAGHNSIEIKVNDDNISASEGDFDPLIAFTCRPASTFDITITNLKVTHEPDTVTVDHTAPPESRIMFIDGNSITISRATGGDIRTITIDGQEITINRTRTVASHARAGSIYYAQGGFKFYQPDGQSLYLQP